MRLRNSSKHRGAIVLGFRWITVALLATHFRTVLRIFSLLLGVAYYQLATSDPARVQASVPNSQLDLALRGARLIGKGNIAVYAKGDTTLFEIPASAFGRLFLWYSEAVSLPSNVVSDALEIGSLVARLERHGSHVIVRDLTSGFAKRAGIRVGDSGEDPASTESTAESINQPIEGAVESGTLGPIIIVWPIIASESDGRVLVDITVAFSNDIEGVSARAQVVAAKLVPVRVDQSRSYLSKVRAFPTNVAVRSHLTFLATDPKDPASGARGVSVEVGHSLVLLPERPMASRTFDKRVGFFTTQFQEYEAVDGAVQQDRSVITRHRLER